MTFKKMLCILFVCIGAGQLFADTASNDRKYAGFVNTRLDRIDHYIEAGSLSSAERDMANAEKYLAKISEGYKSGEGAEMVARMNRLKEELTATIAEDEEADSLAEEVRIAKDHFRHFTGMDSFIDAYHAVADGKEGNFKNLDLDDLDGMRSQMALLKNYAPTFKEEFSILIENEPDYEAGDSDHTTVAEMLDVFEHPDECLDMLENGALARAGSDLIIMLEQGLDEVREEKLISYALLSRLYSDNYRKFPEYNELMEAYDTAGKRMPGDTSNEINSLISQIKDKLLDEAKDHRWQRSDFPNSDSAMSRCIMEEHTSRRIEPDNIKHVGAIPEDEWTVYRNALGTVLYESGRGYAVYSTKELDLPFDLGLAVVFSKPFDGVSFREINDISYSLYYTPFKK